MGDDDGSKDWCDDCHGYTHMPWCPSYGETIPCQRCEGIATTTVTTRHFGLEKLCEPCAVNVRRDGQEIINVDQPAARGGGEEWSVEGGSLVGRRRIRDEARYWVADAVADHVADQIVREHNQHQALVAERERYAQLLTAAKFLLAMNATNYDRDVMRSEGGFDALQKAVDTIEKGPSE